MKHNSVGWVLLTRFMLLVVMGWMASAVYLLPEARAAQTTSGLAPGLTALYAEMPVESTAWPSFVATEIVARGTLEHPIGSAQPVDIEHPHSAAPLALRLTGVIRIDQAGDYTFFLTATQAARLRIGEEWVLQHTASGFTTQVTGSVFLEAGDYPVTLDYAPLDRSTSGPELHWSGPGRAYQPVPAEVLFHAAPFAPGLLVMTDSAAADQLPSVEGAWTATAGIPEQGYRVVERLDAATLALLEAESVRLDGYLFVAHADDYHFEASGAARVWLNEEPLFVDETATGSVSHRVWLNAGYHRLQLKYTPTASAVSLAWSRAGGAMQPIMAESLWHLLPRQGVESLVAAAVDALGPEDTWLWQAGVGDPGIRSELGVLPSDMEAGRERGNSYLWIETPGMYTFYPETAFGTPLTDSRLMLNGVWLRHDRAGMPSVELDAGFHALRWETAAGAAAVLRVTGPGLAKSVMPDTWLHTQPMRLDGRGQPLAALQSIGAGAGSLTGSVDAQPVSEHAESSGVRSRAASLPAGSIVDEVGLVGYRVQSPRDLDLQQYYPELQGVFGSGMFREFIVLHSPDARHVDINQFSGALRTALTPFAHEGRVSLRAGTNVIGHLELSADSVVGHRRLRRALDTIAPGLPALTAEANSADALIYLGGTLGTDLLRTWLQQAGWSGNTGHLSADSGLELDFRLPEFRPWPFALIPRAVARRHLDVEFDASVMRLTLQHGVVHLRGTRTTRYHTAAAQGQFDNTVNVQLGDARLQVESRGGANVQILNFGGTGAGISRVDLHQDLDLAYNDDDNNLAFWVNTDLFGETVRMAYRTASDWSGERSYLRIESLNAPEINLLRARLPFISDVGAVQTVQEGLQNFDVLRLADFGLEMNSRGDFAVFGGVTLRLEGVEMTTRLTLSSRGIFIRLPDVFVRDLAQALGEDPGGLPSQLPPHVLTLAFGGREDTRLGDMLPAEQAIYDGIVNNPAAMVPIKGAALSLGILASISIEQIPFPDAMEEAGLTRAWIERAYHDAGEFLGIDGRFMIYHSIDGLGALKEFASIVFGNAKKSISNSEKKAKESPFRLPTFRSTLYLPRLEMPKWMNSVNHVALEAIEELVQFETAQGRLFIDIDFTPSNFRVTAGIGARLNVAFPRLIPDPNDPDEDQVDRIALDGQIYILKSATSTGPQIAGQMIGIWNNPMGIENTSFGNMTIMGGIDLPGQGGTLPAIHLGFGGTAIAHIVDRGQQRDIEQTFAAGLTAQFTKIPFKPFVKVYPKGLGIQSSVNEIRTFDKIRIADAFLRAIVTSPLNLEIVNDLIAVYGNDAPEVKAFRDLAQTLRNRSLMDLMFDDEFPLPEMVLRNFDFLIAANPPKVPGQDLRPEGPVPFAWRGAGDLLLSLPPDGREVPLVGVRSELGWDSGLIFEGWLGDFNIYDLVSLNNARVELALTVPGIIGNEPSRVVLSGNSNVFGVRADVDVNVRLGSSHIRLGGEIPALGHYRAAGETNFDSFPPDAVLDFELETDPQRFARAVHDGYGRVITAFDSQLSINQKRVDDRRQDHQRCNAQIPQIQQELQHQRNAVWNGSVGHAFRRVESAVHHAERVARDAQGVVWHFERQYYNGCRRGFWGNGCRAFWRGFLQAARATLGTANGALHGARNSLGWARHNLHAAYNKLDNEFNARVIAKRAECAAIDVDVRARQALLDTLRGFRPHLVNAANSAFEAARTAAGPAGIPVIRDLRLERLSLRDWSQNRADLVLVIDMDIAGHTVRERVVVNAQNTYDQIVNIVASLVVEGFRRTTGSSLLDDVLDLQIQRAGQAPVSTRALVLEPDQVTTTDGHLPAWTRNKSFMAPEVKQLSLRTRPAAQNGLTLRYMAHDLAELPGQQGTVTVDADQIEANLPHDLEWPDSWGQPRDWYWASAWEPEADGWYRLTLTEDSQARGIALFDDFGTPVTRSSLLAGRQQLEFAFDADEDYAFTLVVYGDAEQVGPFTLEYAPYTPGTPPAHSRPEAAVLLTGVSGEHQDHSRDTVPMSIELDAETRTLESPLWFRHIVAADGYLTLRTLGSAYDTVLLALEADGSGGWSLLGENDDDIFGLTSRLMLEVAAGDELFIVVDAFEPAFGQLVLDYHLHIQGPPPANTFYTDAFVLNGEAGQVRGTTIDARHADDEPRELADIGFASVWWQWVPQNTGLYTFDTHGSGFDTILGVYRRTEDGEWDTVAFNDDDDFMQGIGPSRVVFNAQAGATYWIAVDGYEDAWGSVVLNWESVVRPANDDLADAMVLMDDRGRMVGDNQYATEAVDEPLDVDESASLWWTLTPAENQVLSLTVDPESSSAIAAYVMTGSSYATLQSVGSPLLYYPGDAAETITVVLNANVPYTIGVWALNDWRGEFALDYALGEPWTVAENVQLQDALPLSGVQGEVRGHNRGATAEVGEPAHIGEAASSVWWRWQAPDEPMIVEWSTAGSDFDTVLAVYRGERVDSLQQVAANDDADGELTSRVRFATIPGEWYFIAVDGFAGDQGTIHLMYQPVAVTPPENGTPETATTLVGAEGQSEGSNVGMLALPGDTSELGAWWQWVAPQAGIFTVDTHGSAFDTVLEVYRRTDDGQYDLIASNDDDGEQLTSRVSLSVHADQALFIKVFGFAQAEGDITLNYSLRSAQPPANALWAQASVLTGPDGQVTGRNTDAGNESNEPVLLNQPNSNSVWWRWEAPSTGVFHWSTAGSDFDTVMAVYQGARLDALELLIMNDDAEVGELTSALHLEATAGETYFIRVQGFMGATGTIQLGWQPVAIESLVRDRFAQAAILANPQMGQARAFLAAAGVEDDEPGHGGTASVWYRLTPERSGDYLFVLDGYSTAKQLVVYRGEALNDLEWVAEHRFEVLEEPANEAEAELIEGAELNLQVPLQAGQTYSIAVVNPPGTTAENVNLSYVLSLEAPTDEPEIYWVTPRAGANGRLDPASPIRVARGDTAVFTVIPDTGFGIEAVRGCGGSLQGDRFTTGAITSACVVEAQFVPLAGPGINDRMFVQQLYQDVLNRDGDPAGVEYWVGLLASGEVRYEQVVQIFMGSAEYQHRVTPIARLYFAYLGRLPDVDGLRHWVHVLDNPLTLRDIADAFASSPESVSRDALLDLDDQTFVAYLYRQVLDREGDIGGMAYWQAQLASGMGRGFLMLNFSESEEYRSLISHRFLVGMLYTALLQREPDPDQFAFWIAELEAGRSVVDLISLLIASAEYIQRF